MGNVARSLLASAGAFTMLTLGACGGGGGSAAGRVPAGVGGDADPADIQAIVGWTRALDGGDIDAAAGYFAIPSHTENGVPLDLSSTADARRFNRSLPCGAKLLRADSHHGFVIATFRLTERPGPGVCGAGAGSRAATAFLIDEGKFRDWRRVPVPGAKPSRPSAPSQSA